MQISVKLLLRFETKESWLEHKSDLHGVAHMTRVFILQELICEQLEREGIKINREAVRFAAMAHDVGRVDDGADPEHGRRSVEWMKENLADRMSPETMDLATYAVHWHVPPDSAAPVMTPELMVLKDADSLDRVRLGDLDPSYLRTDAAKGLVGLAKDLYLLSARDTDYRNEPFAAVLRATKQLGVVAERRTSQQV